MGQAVEPLLYGHSTGLSPFSVVVAATFWTWLWGPIGLILSTPLTLCLVVLGRHVERLEFLDILLGDRPPLTPVESFYQRILAGDPDEARAQAELLLKDHSLSSYYDQVALKGLQLAAADSARGVLTGKYRPDAAPPPDTRAGRQDRRMMESEWRPESLAIAQQLAAYAANRGITPGQFAFAWVLHNRFVTGAVGGPRTEAQWEDYVGALDYAFTPEDEALVNRLVVTGHASTPGYNDPAYKIEGRVPRSR